MAEQQQPTLEQIEGLEFSEVIRIQAIHNCVLVNEFLGIGFADNEHITFVCDKRVPIHRNNSSPRPQEPQAAELGTLTLSLNNKIIIFIGDGFPLAIQRVSPKKSAPIIKVSHKDALDVKRFDHNVHGLKSILNTSLVS